VIDLKSKANRDVDREDDNTHNPLSSGNVSSIGVGGEFDWNVVNEYDPMWPNEYEKVVKEFAEIDEKLRNLTCTKVKVNKETYLVFHETHCTMIHGKICPIHNFYIFCQRLFILRSYAQTNE